MYTLENIDLPENIWFSSSNMSSIGDRIFLLGNYMDKSYLYCLASKGTNPTLVACCEDGSEQWYSYCSFKNSIIIYDAKNHQFVEFNCAGERLRSIPLPDDLYVNDIASGREYVYVLGNGMVSAIDVDQNGHINLKYSINVSPIASIANNPEGKVFIAWRDGETQAISMVDEDSQSLKETCYISSECVIAGTGNEWEVYLRIGGALYGYGPSTGRIQRLVSFSDLGLRSNGVVFEMEDGQLVYTGTSGDAASAPFILMPVGCIEESKTLLLATVGDLPYGMEKAILAWNQSHPECKVEVKNYSAYNSGADSRTADYQLIADIGSGHCPDLYNLSDSGSALDAHQLNRRGLLENLYPYIDNDSSIARSDFMRGPLSALEIDGALPQIAPGFLLLTTIAAAKDVGNMSEWTYQNFDQLVESSDYYHSIFDMGYSRDQWLSIMIAASGEKLVDWTAAKCYFDSDYFAQLLNLSSIRPIESMFLGGSIGDIIEESHSILYMVTLDNLWQAAIADDAYGAGNYVYVGIPEIGSVIAPEINIGMSAQSQNKEQCWQFIREFLVRESPYVTGIPLRRDGAEQQIIDELKEMEEYSLEHPGRKQAMEYLLDEIEKSDVLYQYDPQLWNIVQSETNGFFNGQNSAQQTAQAIQSKANLYLAEQK